MVERFTPLFCGVHKHAEVFTYSILPHKVVQRARTERYFDVRVLDVRSGVHEPVQRFVH